MICTSLPGLVDEVVETCLVMDIRPERHVLASHKTISQPVVEHLVRPLIGTDHEVARVGLPWA